MRKSIQRGIAVMMICALTLPIAGCSSPKAQTIKADSNMLVQTTSEDFKKGEWVDAAVTKDGDGSIELAKSFGKYKKTATYTSAQINADAFISAILSFNAQTPKGTTVVIEEQIKVGDAWSSWMNYANWGDNMKQGSSTKSEDEKNIAYIDVDAIAVKDKTKAADAIRYRVTLNTSDEKITPSVNLVSIAFDSEAKKASASAGGDTIKLDKVLDVPVYSQMERDPQFRNSICSPTSLSMVMKYYGIDIVPEETAWGVFDFNACMFGNWVFNCAYAGSYGLDAYVAYLDSLDDLKREIQNGNPVVCSVRYTTDEKATELPVVHGAAIPSTTGHLLVVCGFKEIDGKEYVVVNDPAADTADGVRLNYLASEFKNAWIGVSYIIHKNAGQKLDNRRVAGVLEATGEKREYFKTYKKEYVLKVDNKQVGVGSDDAVLIMSTHDGKKYSYMRPDSKNTLWFTGEEGNGIYKILIISKKGITYTTEVDWKD